MILVAFFGRPTAQIDDRVETPKLRPITIVTIGIICFALLFERAGLAAAVVHEVIASSKEAKKLTRLRVGQKIEFQRESSGELLAVRTKLTALQTLSLVKSDQGYEVEHKTVTPDIRKAYAQGRITSSLFAAAQKAGLSHDMTMALANIFGYDIDFALDIQECDEFEVDR